LVLKNLFSISLESQQLQIEIYRLPSNFSDHRGVGSPMFVAHFGRSWSREPRRVGNSRRI